MSRLYGQPHTGRFLVGFTGKALCLDYFGVPSVEMATASLGLHGEAACTQWSAIDAADMISAHCRFAANLPIAGMTFEKDIQLGNCQSVAYVQETASSGNGIEHQCNWVQHVTFGRPFIEEGVSTLTTSARE